MPRTLTITEAKHKISRLASWMKENKEDYIFIANGTYRGKHAILLTPENYIDMLIQAGRNFDAEVVKKTMQEANDVLSLKSKHLNE